MQTRELGRNGPKIGAVALGTMNFCGTYGPTTEDAAFRCMAECLDRGVDHFDTSNVYGGGQAEELLGRFFRQTGAKVTLASKFGITRDKARPFNNEPAHMRDCLDGSLRGLGVDHIDLYYVHRRDPSVPVEEIVGAMAREVEAGKIGAIGLSEVAPGTLERAAAVHPIAAVQSEYSLWTRLPELGLLQACQRHGAAFVAFSCLGRGMLSGRAPAPGDLAEADFRRNNPRFTVENFARNRATLQPFLDYCATISVSPASVAIAWVLSRGDHVVALPGSRSASHMAENAQGAALTLDDEQKAQIERLLPVGWAHGARYTPEQQLGPELYC